MPDLSLPQRLAEAEATIQALLSGQIDALVDSTTSSPLLLSRAQEALRASEEQYRQIVENTTDGIVQFDTEERIVFVNRRLAQMLGYEPQEMIGKHSDAFLSEGSRPTLQHSLLRREKGVTAAVDLSVRHRDGSEMAVSVAGSLLADGAGRRSGYLGVVRDVTERNRLQSQLMASDRMASVGTLAAGVAHEINNPLTAIIANLEFMAESLGRSSESGSGSAGLLLRADRLREELESPLADAREAAERVRLIVRDLKVFSRAPAGEPDQSVDVRLVMESTVRMAWNEIRHRARLVKLYGEVPGVRANEARLGQVFLNLLMNAAQAIAEGDAEHNEIRVATRLDGDRVVVEVTDTGRGIQPEVLARVFDAFFTTKPVGVGTGLGLAISQRIVTDCGGELTVRSVVGSGTTFRVALPLDLRRPGTQVPPGSVTAPVVRRGHLLLVDDDAMVLQCVELILSREHDVVALTSAREALTRCATGERFDLILCDLMMPDMTGMDLYREIALLDPEQASRMIFLTGGAFTEAARRFLSDPPRESIEKPFSQANLRAIVQRFLR